MAEQTPLPKHVGRWLETIEPRDVAVNAHKISSELWVLLKERAVRVFNNLDLDDKNDLISKQRGLGCTKDEMIKEELDENRETWRIVQEMCILERTGGGPTMTLHSPTGAALLSVNVATGATKQLVRKCAVCGVSATKKCSGCKMVYYCSAEHQVQAWKAGHNKTCKQLR